MARFSIPITNVVAAEWPDLAFSLVSWWPRSDLTQHSHFYRDARGVARVSVFAFIVVAAECRHIAFLLYLKTENRESRIENRQPPNKTRQPINKKRSQGTGIREPRTRNRTLSTEIGEPMPSNWEKRIKAKINK